MRFPVRRRSRDSAFQSIPLVCLLMNTFFMQSYDATLDGLKQHLFWHKSSPGGPSDFVCFRATVVSGPCAASSGCPGGRNPLKTAKNPFYFRGWPPSNSKFDFEAGGVQDEEVGRERGGVGAPSCTRLCPKNPAESRLQAGAPTFLSCTPAGAPRWKAGRKLAARLSPGSRIGI